MMKVVVVGGVAGGMSAAAKLKRNLKDQVEITVYEKGTEVSYAACGIPYYVSGKVKDASSLVERTAEEFAESGIDVKLRHEVTAVDTKNKYVTVSDLETGEVFLREFDKLIVATGARVRKIPPLDKDLENLCAVRTVADGVAIKNQLARNDVRNVMIVGAGFIGLEVVEACAKHGKNIILVEFAERVLSVMDPEITDRLQEELARNKVDVRIASKVTEVNSRSNRAVSAAVDSAKGKDTLDVDLIINCAGIAPNTEFIDVEKAANEAIVVNERMETSAPDVYSAGDCSIMTSFITGERQYAPLGTNANKQGRIIAELLSGKPAQTIKLLGSSAVRLFDLDVAKVGLTEIDAQRLNLEYKTNRIVGNDYASYYSTGKVTVKLVYNPTSRKILGAQILGHGTIVPRANYYAIAISAGMTVDEFGFLDLCYSPPFSGVWDATMIAANTSK